MIWPIDKTLSGETSGPEWTWGKGQWRCTLHSPKLQHYWKLTIRLFSVIYQDTHWEGVLPLCREAVSVLYSPSRLSNNNDLILSIFEILLFLNVFFCENMIIYVINTKKIWIIHIFKWPLCFKWVVCEWPITSDHHTQSGILLDVWYLVNSQHNPAIFVLL